jgi:hypothetical protein
MMQTRRPPPPRGRAPALLAVLAALAAAPATPAAADAQTPTCARDLEAEIVAFDQLIWYNRLGARDPGAMMFALIQDVQPSSGNTLSPGNVKLRPGKRPRPITLRMNVGDCMIVTLNNFLSSSISHNQPHTRQVSVHVAGMQPVRNILDDGTAVGANAGSPYPQTYSTATYKFYAAKEGTFLLYSTGAMTGGEGDGGQIAKGLFGAVNVQPAGAEWYRSQLTAEEMGWATRTSGGIPVQTAQGHPVINYDAVYPSGHPRAGDYILRMLHPTTNRIVHSDLNAIITGPNRGLFPAGTYDSVVVNRNRHQPFREFTVIFHDETGLVQAFDNVFNDPELEHTLHSGRDAFAINYGTGGIGAEVIANRFGVGPMANCSECKYEEFFLSSWVVGDPAMIVDTPADADIDGDGQTDAGFKATKAFFPDDPSNVFHSYMNDHVKIRNLHAGPKEHHVFHLHAHQWLHSPNSDNSTYLDSQAIGPGAGFTYEITYNGGGNRNKTPGDAILHCHFYPHFAQGMWGLWRVHDVFEKGTPLDANGRPVAGARRLPDGEISAGTPIPGVVPIPTYALAPMPTNTMPGYPFYIPGRAGRRPPRPPLDVQPDNSVPGGYRNGGLARHVVVGGAATNPPLNRFDFSRVNTLIHADSLPETGTPLEVNAMAFHAQRKQSTFRFDPNTGAIVADTFVTNGRPAAAGAPFADPCVNDVGGAKGSPRAYRAASFQVDAKYNKAGWHFPQHRMFSLWADVDSVRNGWKAPEPMFIRANTNDCVTYHLVNLIPKDYELDDFQVKTPTDIVGQHIHLVKFDVTSSDGSANGFNYEDGSMSPGEVVERIKAIRVFNSCTGATSGDARDGQFTCPVPRAHPFFGNGPNGEWLGAMETLSRWFVDDVLNKQGVDRTLRTVFTHDHFGPSTHQQAGLYAGLVTEPAGSTWRDPESGVQFGGRFDGGPTSWRADILTANADSSYREFNLQLADFTLAYQKNSNNTHRTFTDNATGVSVIGIADPPTAINPPGKFEVGLPDLIRAPFARNHCPSPTDSIATRLNTPCPELLSADEPGTMSVNYRNEPIALRVRDPGTNGQASGTAGDLSHVFRSIARVDTTLNSHGPYTQRPGVGQYDPYTPMLRAYEGDRVQIRVLVGAHEEGHNFSVHGVQWLMEPSDRNSGFRNSQMMGISEHYEFVLPPLPRNNIGPEVDYLYRAGSATDDLWNGTWGILRASQRGNGNFQLLRLPNNATNGNVNPANASQYTGICPNNAPAQNFDVTAVLARDALPHTGNRLVYNSRASGGFGPIYDPNAIMYVRTSDLNANGTLKTNVPIEPLVLRTNRGACINMTLRNRLPDVPPDSNGWNTLPPIIDQFNANDVRPSAHVGLHAQALGYDVSRSDGVNVGLNPIQTAAPGGTQTYQWYAGYLSLRRDSIVHTGVAYGGLNLMPADPIEHASKGAVGALVVWPNMWTFREDSTSRASAWAIHSFLGTVYRDHVVITQTDLNLRNAAGPIKNLAGAEDPEDSGQKGVNYRTEPMWLRKQFAPETPLETTRTFNFSTVLTNGQVGGDPQTPVFRSAVGQQTQFHLLMPGGHARNVSFNLHGHIFQEQPWVNGSTEIGVNPGSEYKGILWGHGATNHQVIWIPSPGGYFKITGDYLWRDQTSFHLDGGIWGIFRVVPQGTLNPPTP